ncbi:HAD-IB family hydrolase [Phenylobacterium deserti]|uniref:HAD-IB family hydrolase n=1 Tax=Phenylobacterium deserti TaxID=1914756 RepID=UPI001F0B7D8E|nr:HAD-IB family hydrolase [Phenylobacterium deserti]
MAFDFDGTLTVRDSFTAFLAWRAGPAAYRMGLLRLLPAAAAYLFHRDRGRIKAAAVSVFLRGVPRATLEADARRFADQHARSLFRPDALEAWRRWREEPVRLVIVTASPALTVAPFARALGADDLLGTELAFDAQDRVAGGFASPNCRGPEKMTRLKAQFGENLVLKAAYGDTGGDKEMLEAAETAGFRVFKDQP